MALRRGGVGIGAAAGSDGAHTALPHLSHWLSARDWGTLAGGWALLLAFGKQASESLNGDACRWHKFIMRFNFNNTKCRLKQPQTFYLFAEGYRDAM